MPWLMRHHILHWSLEFLWLQLAAKVTEGGGPSRGSLRVGGLRCVLDFAQAWQSFGSQKNARCAKATEQKPALWGGPNMFTAPASPSRSVTSSTSRPDF